MLGALLLVLPAICLPSMVMVSNVMGRRATAALAGGVSLTGLFGAGLLLALGG